MPALLLQAIKEMNQDDEYILMDGDERARVRPTNGVKQGCPQSPLLFSLYINDMGRDIFTSMRGAVTGEGVNGVSYMKRKEKLHRQRKLSLHELRKRGHIGSEEP
eukprot:219845-Pelagomonas_calceolata.AAC.1